jgi:hypothetical protein
MAGTNYFADVVEATSGDLLLYKRLEMRAQCDTGWHGQSSNVAIQ